MTVIQMMSTFLLKKHRKLLSFHKSAMLNIILLEMNRKNIFFANEVTQVFIRIDYIDHRYHCLKQ